MRRTCLALDRGRAWWQSRVAASSQLRMKRKLWAICKNAWRTSSSTAVTRCFIRKIFLINNWQRTNRTNVGSTNETRIRGRKCWLTCLRVRRTWWNKIAIDDFLCHRKEISQQCIFAIYVTVWIFIFWRFYLLLNIGGVDDDSVVKLPKNTTPRT